MKKTIAATLLALLIASCTGKPEKVERQGMGGVNLDSLLAAAKSFRPEIGKVGGQIVLSTFSDPKSFNPITSNETSTSEFTGYMFEGLTRTNGVTTEVEPQLAQSWSVDSTGKVWTFALRRNVRWFDGRSFCAYDVEFTFNRLIYNDDIPNSSRDIFTLSGKPLQVKALDSFQVQFRLPVKFAPFLASMSQEILPRHKYEEKINRGTFASAMGADSKPGDIVGTGPFMLESYRPSQGLVLGRNPNYWRTDSAGNRFPYLERVRYVIVQDQNAQLLKFQQGETDYLGFRGQDFPLLKRGEKNGGYTVHRLGPDFGTSFLFFNLNGDRGPQGKPYIDPAKRAWFFDPAFRRAVAHGLDKTSIIRIALNGLGYPQDGAMSPASGFFHNPNVPRYEYDPQKSKAILDSLEIRDRNGDGIREDGKGRNIEFTLVTNSGNTVREQIGKLINKDLQNLGFKVHFNLMEFNALIAKLDASRDWDACIMGLTGGIEPHFGANVWQSSGTLHMWWPRQKTPATAWEARVDTIYALAAQELDPNKRKALYDEWQVIAARELPLIYTVLSERLLALRNKFGNINPAPYGGLLYNLEQIYVR